MSRADGIAKVTGQATYTGDLKLPGMAQGRLLTSTFPHALIKSIDTRAARALPGVLAVLTADDLLPDVDIYSGEVIKDQPALAVGKVRHVGEPLAAVAAVNARTAEQALRLIQVDYEPLPVVDSLEAALAPGAALVHDGFPSGTVTNYIPNTNIIHTICEERGDIEHGFAEADQIFEDEFVFPRVYQYPMEAPTWLAQADARGVTLWVVTQNPFSVQRRIETAFRLPRDRVRVLTPYLGSGFGGRSKPLDVVAVALARAAGVPVKLVLSIADDMMLTRRGGVRGRLRTGVLNDGTIVAREAVYDYECGAYTGRTPRYTRHIGSRAMAGYRTPHFRFQGRCIQTNTAPAAAYRSPGMQMIWGREVQFDRIARALGIDPLEFRRRNLLQPGEEVEAGALPLDSDLVGDLEKVGETFGWEVPAPQGRGRAVAVGMSAPSARPPSGAVVYLHADGTLTVIAGGVEMGQGLHDTMARVAALELGIPPESAQVVPVADTHTTPYDAGSGGSRNSVMTGLAVQMAVRDVKTQVLALASDILGSPTDQLQIRDGMVNDGRNQVPLGDVVKWFFTPPDERLPADSVGIVARVERLSHGSGSGNLIGRAVVGPDFENGRLSRRPAFYEVAMGAAEVEVDRETGVVKLLRYTALADAGKVLADPVTARGQVVGAAMQGLGHSLSEEMIFQDGQPLNGTLMDYRVPIARDVAASCDCIFVENEDGPGPFGAKGMGQSSIIPIAPAITSAIAEATGVYVRELPLSPERVWRALSRQADAT